VAASIVQSKTVIGQGVTSVNATFDNPTTTGNTIIILYGNYYDGAANSGTPWGASDNGSHSWTDLGHSGSGSSVGVEISYAYNITGQSGHQVTASFSSASYPRIMVLEVSGLLTTDPGDKYAGQFDNDGNSSYGSGNTATTSEADEFLIGLVMYIHGDTVTITPSDSSSVYGYVTDSSFGSRLAVSTRSVTSTGAYAATGSMSSSGNNTAVIGTFKVASTAAAAVTGTATDDIVEGDIVSGGKTVIITLTDETYVPATQSTEITYVGGQVGSFAGKTGTTTVNFSLTNGLASTPAAGDFVIVSYSVGSGSATDRALTIQNASSTNYTLIDSELFSSDTFSANLRVAYRFMPGTPETSMVLSGTGNNADAGAYTIHVFRNVDSSTPLDVAAVSATGQNTRVANPAQITPTTSGAKIFVVAGAACGTGGTWTAGYLTDLRATSQADTNDAMIGSGYLSWTSGAYDPAAFGAGGTDTTDDSWCALTVALRPVVTTPFADARSAIRDGLDSAQSEAAGWDAKVKPNIPLANIVRTSDTVCTITLQAQSDYNITAQETITVTVPSTALTGGDALVATPTFTVDPAAGGAFFTARLTLLGAGRGSYTT